MATLKMIETTVPEVGDTAVIEGKPVGVSFIVNTGVEDMILFSDQSWTSQGEFLQNFYFGSEDCWKPLD